MNKVSVSWQEGQNGLFASAVWDAPTQSYIVKVINTSNDNQPLALNFAGLKNNSKLIDGVCITFSSPNTDLENTIEQPNAIIPQENSISIEGIIYNINIAPHTFAIYKFPKQ